MKCSQKLCQRTKHISSSGNCNVCEDVIETLRKANEAKIKKSNFEKVELDLKKEKKQVEMEGAFN